MRTPNGLDALWFRDHNGQIPQHLDNQKIESKMANPRRLIGIFVALTLVGAAGFLGYKKVEAINSKKADSTKTAGGKATAIPRPDSVGATFDAGTAIPVVGAEVIRGPLIIWVTAQGAAASSHQIALTSEAAGRVEKVNWKEGELVKAGDTLLMVDTSEMVYNLKQAQYALARAENNFKNATLSDWRIPDEKIRKDREAAARMSSGLVDAQLSLERAKMEFAKAATRTPISGRIGNVKVVPGQRVGSGTEIMTVALMDPIRVNAEVLQSELSKIKEGNQARLVFASYSDTTFTGTVEQINPFVDPILRTARVTIAVKNPRGLIVPGMTARVEVQSQTYENRLLVPAKAILQRSDGRDMLFVYIPNKDGTDGRTDWRYVNKGLENREFVEISPGVDGSQKMVEPKEIVLVDGHYTIEHQTLVRLVDRLSGIAR